MKTQSSSKRIELSELIAPFTVMSDAEAVRLAKDTFGISGRVTRFATEKDDTFGLESLDGRRFVLKVANPAEDSAELDFQVAILEHIAAVDHTLPVPRVIRTTGNLRYDVIVDAAGQHRKVRLMSFLAGTPLDSTHSSAAQRERVGEVLARLRLATATFSHPAAARIVPWNVQNLPGLTHLLGDVADREKGDMLALGVERLARLESSIGKLRSQVLHNDFSKSNLVVDHDSTDFVTGVIDFGDAVYTAIAIDVSTALLNQLPRNTGQLPDEDMFADGRDVLRGYLRDADLTDEELALIPHLVMARVITRALLSLGLAKRFPNNSRYLLRNTEQGWAQLDWFLRRSPDEISHALDMPALN